jgi:hypothetical protein
MYISAHTPCSYLSNCTGHTMSAAGAEKTTMLIGNGVADTYAQRLQHIGAIHDHLSVRDHHLHLIDMYHEL